MNKVWVVETFHAGRWVLMTSWNARANAWGQMRACRQKYKSERFRTVIYVPAKP